MSAFIEGDDGNCYVSYTEAVNDTSAALDVFTSYDVTTEIGGC